MGKSGLRSDFHCSTAGTRFVFLVNQRSACQTCLLDALNMVTSGRIHTLASVFILPISQMQIKVDLAGVAASISV